MLRLRSRLLISLASGIVAVGILILPILFGKHPGDKSIEVLHRSPFVFALVWAALGIAIAVVVLIVLTLIAWGLKRLPAPVPAAEGGVRQLYSPNQAFCAALLGGPLAAVALIKTNYLTLGNPTDAKKSNIIGWCLSTAFFLIIIVSTHFGFDQRRFWFGISIGYSVGAKSLVGSLQRTTQSILESDIYFFKSNWRVVGLGVGYLAASWAILSIAAFILISFGYDLPK